MNTGKVAVFCYPAFLFTHKEGFYAATNSKTCFTYLCSNLCRYFGYRRSVLLKRDKDQRRVRACREGAWLRRVDRYFSGNLHRERHYIRRRQLPGLYIRALAGYLLRTSRHRRDHSLVPPVKEDPFLKFLHRSAAFGE